MPGILGEDRALCDPDVAHELEFVKNTLINITLISKVMKYNKYSLQILTVFPSVGTVITGFSRNST